MPKSIKRYDENTASGQYEKNATELIAEAIELERQAATAKSPELAAECRAKAQELRGRALQALQIRKEL